MSFLSDALGFETFHAKDLWDRIKKDPKRLVLGVDPLSTKVWNKALGKHDDPLVDQLGGAYGGHTISAFGNNEGGVYGRAEKAGIDTGAGKNMQNVAHLVSAFFGGQGLSGIGGGAQAPAAPQQGLGVFANNGANGLAGVGGGNAGALAQSGGIGGGAGMGSATETAAPSMAQLMGKGGFGSMPGMSTGAPQQQAPPPQYNPPQAPPPPQTMGQKMMGGLGRARDALTPIDPRMAAEMDPAYLKQMRNQAMLRMGLGMMSTANQGGRFGESLAAGLGQAQGGFNKDVEGTYQRGVKARDEQRDTDRQTELDKRYYEETGRQRDRDSTADKQWQKTFDANEKYRKDSLASLERRAASKVAGTTMTDEAIDLAAGRIVNGEKARDVLANFGRGNQGSANITAVQNRVAAMAKERGLSAQEFAIVNQELSAQARARIELGAREGKIAPRVQEAQNFAHIALDASAKVPREKFLPWNKLTQLTDKQLNDPDLAAFKAATVSLINAYAGAVGGGQMHVHDQQVAENMLNTAQSPEAYAAVVNQLLKETEAALDAPGDVMERMRNQGLGHGAVPPSPSAPVGVVNWSDLK